MEPRTVPCVGAIILDDRGRMLLVRRANEPARGSWSVPGGRVEAGETDQAATAREVLEETGLAVSVGALVGTVERSAPDGATYLIHDYRCEPVRADAIEDVVAGDDAADVGWFTAAEVRRLPCSPGLVDTLEAWGLLPR